MNFNDINITKYLNYHYYFYIYSLHEVALHYPCTLCSGLPFPRSVNITSSSNVSLTVAWDSPTPTGYIITGYLVRLIL